MQEDAGNARLASSTELLTLKCKALLSHMLFPEPMEIVEMVVPASSLRELVDALGEKGFLHFGPSSGASASAELREKAEQILAKASEFKGPAPTKQEVSLSSWDDLLNDFLDRLTRYADQKHRLESAKAQVDDESKKLIAALETLKCFPPSFDLTVFSSLGTDLTFKVYRFEEQRTGIALPCAAISDDVSGGTTVIAVMDRGKEADVGQAVTRQGGRELQYPDWLPPVAADAIEKAEGRLRELTQQSSSLSSQLDALISEASPMAVRAAETAEMLLRSLDAGSGEPFTEETRVVTGFVPSARLKEALDVTKEFPGVLVFHRPALPSDRPPTWQRLPRLVSSFGVIVGSFGLPGYGEVDPTLITAITFPILFALMFPDAGQALVLALSGAALYKFGKGPMKDLGAIVLLSGLAAVFSGLAFGEFFGLDFHPLAFHIFDWQTAFPIGGTPFSAWQPSSSVASSTSSYVVRLMILSMGVGVLQMTSGFALSVVNKLKKGLVYQAISSELPKAVLLPSAFSLIVERVPFSGVGALLWVALVLIPFVLLYASPVLGSALGLGETVVEGIMEAVESTIAFISNTFSYLRLLAMAVAHLALMLVVFLVAWLAYGAAGEGLLGWACFWAIVAVGNFVVMAFEALLVFIQSMRLHFYEWMMKFFSGDGRAYSPLSYDGKTVKIRLRLRFP